MTTATYTKAAARRAATVRKAVDIVITAGGGPAALAKALSARGASITAQGVCNWRARGRVPAEHAVAIEQITGISRHVTRPDVFGSHPINP